MFSVLVSMLPSMTLISFSIISNFKDAPNIDFYLLEGYGMLQEFAHTYWKDILMELLLLVSSTQKVLA